ncbi:hypothetical protein [Erwinia sp. OPT-41]|uniref:Uncharacterized protein n=1 Tax=Erwinia plantamica TaxID=3237104 RepID=A0ABW7CNA4_9GAMM
MNRKQLITEVKYRLNFPDDSLAARQALMKKQSVALKKIPLPKVSHRHPRNRERKE